MVARPRSASGHHPSVLARLLGRATRRPLVVVAAFYGVAAVVATAPAVSRFGSAFISTGLPGYGEAASGDHLQTVYRFWLVGHQLEHGAAPWRDPYSYQPLVDPQLVVGGWPFGLFFWPLDALLGPVIAWNALLLAGVVAAGMFTYLWLTALGVSAPASAAGGLVFAVAPYRLLQSGGHLLGWAAILLPLSLWALERARVAKAPRAAHAWGGLAAVALLSIPLSGQLHLGLAAVPLLLAYAAIRFRPTASLWTAAGALAAVGIGLALRTFVIEGSTASEGRSLEEVSHYSAGWLDLVSRWRLDGLERFVYVGWLTPTLALAGLAVLLRRRRALAVLLAVAAVAPLLLALGTNLPTYAVLRDALPPLRFPRVPGRMVPVANLALAALVAFALAPFFARFRGQKRTAVIGLAVVALAADLLVFPLRSSAADPANGAYARLDDAAPGRVLELPVFERGTGQYGSVYLYYTTQAPRERPTGYSLAPGSTFGFTARYNRLDCGAWLPDDREELRRLGISYLVFHEGMYEQARVPGAWFAWRGLARSGYGPLAHDGAVWLFAQGGQPSPAPPVPEPDRSEPVFCDGWQGNVLEGEEGALWTWAGGRIDVVIEAARRGAVHLQVDGRPAATRTVRGRATIGVTLGRLGWHALVVRGDPGLSLALRGSGSR
jgi:hypothetical protein